MVKTSMLELIREDEQLKSYNVTINKVYVVRDKDNTYNGVAETTSNQDNYPIKVKIDCRRTHCNWEVTSSTLPFSQK